MTALNVLQAQGVRVLDLKVDGLDRPLSLENPRPRLSWRLESSRRNVRQSAYRIVVARSEEAAAAGHGDAWDSGRVGSSRSFGIQYAGRELTSRRRCWWTVQVWDERGEPSAPSAVSCWEMGLLETSDWCARWLAVEDARTRADRETGLQWIWGASGDETRPRGFRLKFRLQHEASCGELFVAVNETLARVGGVWIDGRTFADSGSASLSGQWLTMPSLGAGEHVLAVEAVPVTPSIFMSESVARRHGLTLFARLNLQNGAVLRICSGPAFKTDCAAGRDWFAPSYDDAAWGAAIAVSALSEGHQPWPAQPAMYLRRELSIAKPLVQARLYATALGCYEARLNGRRVGDAHLTPEPSQYARRLLYQAYDVTALLEPGPNTLGLIVGDGFYASTEGRYAWAAPPRRVLAQLELTFADGTRETITTGPDWRIAASPIVASEMKRGEIHDARLEQSGWDCAGFNDAHWQSAHTAERPACTLAAQTSPPIRVTEVLQPLSIAEPRPAIFVVDFGRHFAGWCRLHVKGESGRRIELQFAELLAPSGEVDLNRWNLGTPKQDVFILKGAPEGETFEPRFTYRGFRYVQLTGLPARSDRASIEGCFVHSDLKVTGRLRSDSPLLERIWLNTLATQRSNFVGIPTDCPSREQRAFMADAGIFWDAAAFNMDVCAFTARQMDNVLDDQSTDGSFSMYAPCSRWMAEWLPSGSTPVWADGAVILPWTAWQRYGALDLVARCWEAMNRYVQSIADRNPDCLYRHGRGSDLGDWLAVEQVTWDTCRPLTTPKDLIGTAYWAYSTDLLAQMAQALGRDGDAARLRASFQCIRRAFNQAFVTAEGTVGNGSQTSYVLALKFRLLPENLQQAAAAHLVADIERRGVALSTGIVGTQFILDVLVDAGYAELAYSLLLRTEYPSWGYMVERGATTIWENWRGELDDAGRISRNHFALGAVAGFLFRRVAGIEAYAPGFEVITIRPILDERLKRGGADYDSIMGRISTDWERTAAGELTLAVTVPANACARVHLPTRAESRIEEGGREISQRGDMRIARCSDREILIEVGSGTYRFIVSGCGGMWERT